MKKIFTVLIFVFVTFFPISCEKPLPETQDFECEFDTKEKTVSIIGYTGKEEKIVIPEAFGDYTVTSIGRAAFSNMYDLTEIAIPDTVTTIGASAFELCISISKIKLPEKLEIIGNAAFSNCRGLKEIFIPESVSDLGLCVFTGCTSLEKIDVDESNRFFSSDSYGVLMNKNKTIVIQFPLGNQRPSYEMPNTVTVISSYAFENTQYVENVIFSESLRKIECYAFQKSSIKSASFGNNLEELGAFCFNEAMLTALELGNSVRYVGDSAFSWCMSLSDIDIPASVESLGVSAFYMCTSVEKFTVNNANDMYSSDQYGVLFDKNMTILIQYPAGSHFEEYSVPCSVTEISARAFSNSYYLKKVTIPDTVNTIADQAFAKCIYLDEIIYEGTKPEKISENAFEK